MVSALNMLAVILMAAAGVEIEETVPRPQRVQSWSPDFIDPSMPSRFSLATRGLFSDGESPFGGDPAIAFEARGQIGFRSGFGFGVFFPVGVAQAEDKQRFLLGNMGLGGTYASKLTSGGGYDVYAGGAIDVCFPLAIENADRGLSALGSMRGAESWLYVSRLFAGRLRGHVEAQLGALTAAIELGVTPGASLFEGGGAVVLLGGAGRIGVVLASTVEPFLEASAATQIAGKGEITPPFLLTSGVRFHIVDAFSPALFASLNFVEASAVMFGLDLAGIVRPNSAVAREERATESFFDDTGPTDDF